MQNLKSVDILKLQTKHMQQDPTTQGMCTAVNAKLKQVAEEVKHCLITPRVEELPEELLDELAWELHVDWYDSTASIDIKRNLIKNSDKVHMYLGTPYAIEQVVQDYFGDGYVEEWFEYDGQPYYFRVVTSNPSVTGELTNQFTKAVEKVKNARSRLEQVIIAMSGEMDLYFASVIQTGDFITIEQVV